jgi:hypothetical protein
MSLSAVGFTVLVAEMHNVGIEVMSYSCANKITIRGSHILSLYLRPDGF